MSSRVKLGIAIPQAFPGQLVQTDRIREHLARAEALGFHSAWVVDQTLGSIPSLAPVELLTYASALTTPMDLARFARMMLREGVLGSHRILSPAAVRAATRTQLEGMKDLPADDRRCRPWGLGWRLNWPAHSANFGEFLGPRAYGHWGATGTALWIDPDLDAFLIFLTTQPQEPAGTYLARASNMVLAAFV